MGPALPDQVLLVRALDEAAALAEVDDPHLGAAGEGLPRVHGPGAEGQGPGSVLSKLGLAFHPGRDGLGDYGFFQEERLGGGRRGRGGRAKGADGEEDREPRGEGDNDYGKDGHGSWAQYTNTYDIMSTCIRMWKIMVGFV